MFSPGAVAAGGAARLTTRAVTTRLLFAVPFVFAGVAAVLLVPYDDEDLERLLIGRSPRFRALLDRSRKSIQEGKGLSEASLGRLKKRGSPGWPTRTAFRWLEDGSFR